MKNFRNIFLVGPMGSGKTSIGRRLAKAIHAEFFDTDHEIEKRTGATIPLVFEIEGEPGFRKRESEVLDELTKYSDIVLATGGGVVLDSFNRKVLVERGIVVYLRAGINHLLKRTARDSKRPLLNCDNPREKMQQLLTERGPLYEEVADITVDTDKHSMKKVVEIVSEYRSKKCGAYR
ncbi:MAG: shikimate kinase AroK [Gammaproteobacteria bacterium]|nr:shikimate kinase AroK [Gammaproteobacteria bacterium]